MSRFGLRKKVKQLLGMVDPDQPQRNSSPVVSPSVQTNVNSPQSVSVPKSPPVEQKVVAPEELPQSDEKKAPSEEDQKILKHRRRTKVALLKLAVKSNGTAPLADLHDLAERRYFIAHKAFSDLMEEMVAEGIFLYDWSAGEATITDLGTEWIESDAKGKKK